MSIIIDNPELFKEALSSGINLFTGAGFSVLESPSGNKLPNAKDLAIDICSVFNVDISFADDLEMLSGIVNSRSKQQFYEYLRSKYTVNDYNPLYDVVDSIKIRSFITTNIDNIIQCVFDNSSRHYLQNMVLRGAVKNDAISVTYIPLHGDVNNPNAKLYFGKNELASVDDDNKELFHVMEAELKKAPTLFCGYGFHDAGVYRIVAKIIENHRHGIWVQCMPDDIKSINYFRELGCSVIIADIEQLLCDIKSKIPQLEKPKSFDETPKELKHYVIPTINQLAPITRKDYFLNAITDWYCILADYPSEVSYVDILYETMLSNKNTVVIGIPFSGKTTLLMQVAAKVKRPNIKLFISSCTPECAKLIVNNLVKREAVIFIDDLCDDIEAAKILMKQPNIRVVGIDDDYIFETTKHLIEDVQYKRIEYGELSISDSQKIFSIIPESFRQEKFSYKDDETDKFSMLEMMGNNVCGILTYDRIDGILRKIREVSPESFEVIAIAVYLSVNKSALNTEVLISYFGNTDYVWINDLVSGVANYLSDIDVPLSVDDIDQDYYNLRSRLFLKYSKDVLITKFKRDFRSVIRKLILNVPPFRIYNYYVFKRTAYDAVTFFRLFDDTAHDLYKTLYKYENTAYTLQQWALYKSKLKDFQGAFIDIDTAINMNPNNFSIRNTHAIILFDANRDFDTPTALNGMKDAMSILEQCFQSDKRKVYHAKKYAEFAIFFATKRNVFDYLSQAKLWLSQIIESGDSKTSNTKKLYKDIESLLG